MIIEPVLWAISVDPVTGLHMAAHQLDPHDVDEARRWYHEFDTAVIDSGIPITHAVIAGGVANYRGRLPNPTGSSRASPTTSRPR